MLVGDKAPTDRFDVAIIPMDDAALRPANALARSLRSEWNTVEIYSTGKLKRRMARANEAGALVAVLIGEDELAAGELTVRDLHDGEQARVAPGDVGQIVSKAQNAHWLRRAEADGIAIPDPDTE